MVIVVLASCLLLLFFFLPDSPKKQAPAGKDYITILWADWAPAGYLQQLTKDFTNETGIMVDILQESWTDWQSRFFDEMKVKGDKYDMVIGDSQWLGRGAMGGHYVSLTKWMRENRVHETMTESSIAGYSEFPRNSGNYWAVPLEGDAMAFSYRKDLFEDPEEKKRFRARYGYGLDVPGTWKELRDIAEFFYRPDENLYGILVWTEPDYDGITMGIDAFIWAWGASLGNRENYQVKGHIDSKKAVRALEYYRELNRFNNPEWTSYYLDSDSSSNQPMMGGKVAMAMCYLAIAPELLDPHKNRYHGVTGFFPTPKGPGARATSLGGQGISIISYSKKKALSLKFLEWFIREDVQKKWAEKGGLSCNRKVLESRAFLSASPVNRPYRESMEIVRDFWAVPEYPRLLAVSQKHWSRYITTGEPDAEETMNVVAKQWEEIFDQAGYYRE